MELELGLAPPNHGELKSGSCGKRASGALATLPLFVREDGNGGGGDNRGAGDWEMTTKWKRLVGWPPVKCARRHDGGGFVKVNMEGVAIGRKVDVSVHTSYEDLLRTLDAMFPAATNQGSKLDRRRRPYAVTYDDGDGDWLLVGDVAWEAFAKSVKRLKILV